MTSPPSAPAPAPAASDAPARRPGLHTRSGNAMARTRGNLLDAAAHCVERYGVRRTTMGDVALKAAVAKATLYNHFRTKDDVLAALVDARCSALAETCAAVAAGRPPPSVAGLQAPDLGRGLGAALRVAAAALAADRPLRRVVADEPALAARLATPGEGRAWDVARTRVAHVLEAAGAPADPPAVAVVLRWLAALVLAPASVAEVELTADVLEAGLSRRSPAGAGDAAAGT